MDRADKPTRAYRAPRREAGAARTRAAVAQAAAASFATRGWSATTMRLVAQEAGVSLKTVEALYGTKAALLSAAVDFAIRGDAEPLEMPLRPAVEQMEHASTAARFLDLHAAHVTGINARSAAVAAAVEQAATADQAVALLWGQMNRNRTYAARWATDLLLSLPGRRRGLVRADVEATFWVAVDWATYRTLTGHAGLSPSEFEGWLRRLYRRAFL